MKKMRVVSLIAVAMLCLAETLRGTHWFGGNPYQYQVYGHRSFDYRGIQKDRLYKAIVSLRNPSEKPVDYELSLSGIVDWDMERIASCQISRRVYGLDQLQRVRIH